MSTYRRFGRRVVPTFCLLLCLATSLSAQSGVWPPSAGAGVPNVASLPGTCSPLGPNYVVWLNTGTVGLYFCLTTNTYTQAGAGSAGTVTSAGLVGTANQITVTGASPITGSGSWTLTLPSVLTLPGTINKYTLTAPATGVTITIADGKTFTLNNSITFAGTDATQMTFPATTAVIARTDAANTFTGVQTFSTPIAAGSVATLNQSTTGNAATATALAANGSNCSAGSFPLGVDASGASESCTALPTTLTGTANQITVSGATGAITLSIPTNPTLPGTTTGTFSGNITGNVTGNTSGTAATITGVLVAGNIAKQDIMNAPSFCADAGATDTYACNLSPAVTAYVTGTRYRFKANTANTGAASINFNTVGAATIVKVAGGITTALADNDIRAGQWVDVTYDGTNMQMQGLLGNAPAGSGTVTVVGAGTLTSTDCVTGGGTQTIQTPSANCTIDSSGNLVANSISTGATAPSLSWWSGTAGISGFNTGTSVGTVPAGAGFLISLTGNIPEWLTSTTVTPLVQGPTSSTNLHIAQFSGTTGGLVQDLATTGTGNAVLATSPTLVTPALGTPSSGVMTNLTGLPLAATPLTTRGDILVVNSTPALARLTKGTQYQTLQGGSSDTLFDAVHLDQATAITGLLPAANLPNSGVMTGDVTTTFPAVTVAKVNGISYSATAAAHTVEVITSANTTATAKVLPDCTDSGGNHLNYAQSTDAFSCGTSSSGGGGSTGTSVTSTTTVTANANSTSDQALMELTLSSGYFNSAGQPFLINGGFVYTIQTAQTPTVTIKAKLCTVSGCGSGTVITLASLVSSATQASTNNPLNIAVMAYTHTTGASGNLEVHGPLAIDLGSAVTSASTLFNDTNTAVSSNIDLTAALFLDFTVTFSTQPSTPFNSITQRAGGVMPFAATAAPVTSFSGDGALISNSSSTGAVTATLATAGAHKTWMNNTGSTAAAGYQSIGTADLPTALANQTSINGVTVPSSVTSGGIMYASSTSAEASSALMTQYGVVFGGGVGAAPTVSAQGAANMPLIGQGAANPIFSTIAYPTSLTSGGVVGATSTTAMASSAIWPAGGIGYGTGAGAVPLATAAGTAKQVVLSGGAGAPTMIDFPDVKTYPAANCVNAVAGSGWSLGASGVVTCRGGTNNLGGFVSITDTAGTFAQFTAAIPADWDSATRPYILVAFESATDTTNGHTVIPEVAVSCPTTVTGTSTDDVTLSAYQSMTTVTFGASAVAHGFYTTSIQIGSTQMSGCIAGGMMIVSLGRATDTGTGVIGFYYANLTFPRLIALQAN